MQVKNVKRLGQIGVIVIAPFLLLVGFSAHLSSQAQAQGGPTGSNNLIFNGNFEFGFYYVPELGFEAPDNGWVPNDWNWFKSQTFGKYNIYNNEGFGIVCPDDISQSTSGKNSLSLHMQSTDQQDARLGVYQTVNVTPGQEYFFSISGTIQAQHGARGHFVELLFDHTGGSDWRAIPHEQWTLLPWKEQELEFNTSGPDDPDIAMIESYSATVRARSDKITIFLSAWRLWPNWRTTIFTLDCISLVPLSSLAQPAAAAPEPTTEPAPEPTAEPAPAANNNIQPDPETQPESDSAPAETRPSTGSPQAQAQPAQPESEAAPPETQPEPETSTTETQPESGTQPEQPAAPTTEEAQPPAAAAPESQPESAPVQEPTNIPTSGGILDTKESAASILVMSTMVIFGLVGAGIWNSWRKKAK